MAKDTLKTAIGLVNTGQRYPVIALVRDNPHLAAAGSKLIAPKEDRVMYDNQGNRMVDPISMGTLSAISRSIARKSKDAAAMLQMFPETELAAQILISSIISPKDMTKGDINIVAGDNLKSELLNTKLLKVLTDYFDKDYKIKPLLPEILRNVLIKDGSDPHVVIPENSIDDLINGSSKISLESLSDYIDLSSGYFKHLGYLGNPNNSTEIQSTKTIAFESYQARSSLRNYQPAIVFPPVSGVTTPTTNIVVIDNPFVLKFPKVTEKNMQIANESIMNNARLGRRRSNSDYTLREHSNKLNDRQLTALFYKRKHPDQVPFVKVRTDDEMNRSTIGKPLVMKLPAESVIPVFTPGNEKDHVGYFILLEADGTPVNGMANTAYEEALASRLGSTGTDMSSYLLQRSKEALYGRNCVPGDPASSKRVFMDIIESDLLARLRNGVIGKKVTIAKNEDVYNLMLARHFANQMTQLLYVPKSMLTYFSYRVDERGIGRSMLDDTAILNSLRAMVLFAKVQNQTKNSIGTTVVDLELDPEDPDPDKTIAIAQHESARLRQADFPVGITAVNDIAEWTARANMVFNVSGHPGVPQMKMTYSENSRSNPMPETDLEETLRKRTVMTMGLSPETVEAGVNANFSRSVVLDNILFAKRVIQIQEVMLPQFTEHLRTVVMNDGDVITEMTNIVKENYDDVVKEIANDQDNVDLLMQNKDLTIKLLVSEFISNFSAELPSADFKTIESQTETFRMYEEIVDIAIKYYITPDMINSDFAGMAADKLDEVQYIFKAYFMRKYMRDNNILPEIAEEMEKITNDDNLTSFLSTQSNHINQITKLVVKLLQKTHPVGVAADKDISNITGGEDLTAGSSSTADSGGNDDFGTGFDTGLDDLASSVPEPEDTQTNSEEVTETTTSETKPADGDTSSDGLGDLPPATNVENP